LNLSTIAEGIRTFAGRFKGKLVTETMLLKGINDSFAEMDYTARFIASIQPHTAYISIPTRPPAFKEAIPADENAVNKAYHIFKNFINNVELLTGYEGNAFASTGNSREDILSITAVHPMREDAVSELLRKTQDDSGLLNEMILENLIEKITYNDQIYYLRKFKK